MGIDCYYMPGSAPCRAVLLAAKNLGVELNLKLVNLMAGEHLKPEFIAMNPQHTIPTLDDNGFYLSESRAIIQYLANAYGKNDSLYPKDPKKRFLVEHRLAFDMGTLYHRFGDCYYPVIFAKAKVDPEKVNKLNEALGWTNDFLKDNSYIAGNNLTIADFSVMATLSTIEAVGHDLSPYANITTYMSKLKGEIDGYVELNQQGADQFGEWARTAIKGASA
jgi:glutathione S-transferase